MLIRPDSHPVVSSPPGSQDYQYPLGVSKRFGRTEPPLIALPHSLAQTKLLPALFTFLLSLSSGSGLTLSHLSYMRLILSLS